MNARYTYRLLRYRPDGTLHLIDDGITGERFTTKADVRSAAAQRTYAAGPGHFAEIVRTDTIGIIRHVDL
uniref:Uncharacterized protein n=1 Tax=viral metagenome TaxID=1070528 RepID=A0A6M3IKA9_9ZZZZ